jgi:hypothetical protein
MCKRITISHLLKARPNWVDATVASLLLGLGVLGSTPTLGQCRPAAPAPCAADGMCYPNRNTWGSYTTNWRPFPGDTVGVAPTPAAEDARIDQLPPYIVPGPEQEDLRGPVRPTRPVAPAGQPAAEGAPPAIGQPLEQAPPENLEQPGEPAADEAPAPLDNLDLPGFAPPQSLLQPLPHIEDGPPALPSALSRAITMSGGVDYQSTAASQTQLQAAPTANANSSPKARAVTIADSRFVTPAASNIELINPAAKNVQKTMDQDLEQAIYYEASDIPEVR